MRKNVLGFSNLVLQATIQNKVIIYQKVQVIKLTRLKGPFCAKFFKPFQPLLFVTF